MSNTGQGHEQLRQRVIQAVEHAVRMGAVGYAILLVASAWIALSIPASRQIDLHSMANACCAKAMMVVCGFLIAAVILDSIMLEGKGVIRFERTESGGLGIRCAQIDWVRLYVVFFYMTTFMTLCSLAIRYVWLTAPK